MIWTVTTSGVYVEGIRADLDASPIGPLEWTGTADGAWTAAAAELAWRVDQGAALLASMSSWDTAPAAVVVQRALQAQIVPSSGSRSRYTLRVQLPGTVTQGQEMTSGAGPTLVRWRITSPTGTYGALAALEIEAEEPGAFTLADAEVVTVTVPIPTVGLRSALRDDADPGQIGTPPTSAAEIRPLVRRERLSPRTSTPGLRSRVIDLPWVVACSIRGNPVTRAIRVVVSPGPVGDDQRQALARRIYETAPAGAIYDGTDSEAITGADGRPVTIAWREGATQPVTVAWLVTRSGSLSEDSVREVVEARTRALFADLEQGAELVWYQINSKLGDAPGVKAALVAINGGVANVSPTTSADVLVPGTISVAFT